MDSALWAALLGSLLQEIFLWARSLLIVQFCSTLGLRKNYQALSSKHWQKCFWHLQRFVQTFCNLLFLSYWPWFREPLWVYAIRHGKVLLCFSPCLFLWGNHSYFFPFFFFPSLCQFNVYDSVVMMSVKN